MVVERGVSSFWFAGLAWQLEQDANGRWVVSTMGHGPMLHASRTHRIMFEARPEGSPVDQAKKHIYGSGCGAGTCQCAGGTKDKFVM